MRDLNNQRAVPISLRSPGTQRGVPYTLTNQKDGHQEHQHQQPEHPRHDTHGVTSTWQLPTCEEEEDITVEPLV